FLGVRAAQSFKLPLLQRTQQFRLNLDWNVPDFVQKQRTPVSKLKPSDLLRDRTGECASLVPKELTLKQSGGNGGTIELYKGPVLTATAIVDHTRNQFFSRSRFAQEQYRRVTGSHGLYQVKHMTQSRTLAHNSFKVHLTANLVFEI